MLSLEFKLAWGENCSKNRKIHAKLDSRIYRRRRLRGDGLLDLFNVSSNNPKSLRRDGGWGGGGGEGAGRRSLSYNNSAFEILFEIYQFPHSIHKVLKMIGPVKSLFPRIGSV